MDLLKAINAVRDSGLTNMWDRRAVIDICDALGFADEAEWLRDNPNEYIRAVIQRDPALFNKG